MVNYNINTISFLIESFNDTVKSFGKNSKSVDFYKGQVKKLIAIRQVNIQDANIVEEIVGMQNTSAVKWDIAENKINSFIVAMNAVIGYDSQEAKMFVIKDLVDKKVITAQIASIIYKLYGIDDGTKARILKKKDTTDTSKTVQETKKKDADIDLSPLIERLRLIIQTNVPNTVYIRVKNLAAEYDQDSPVLDRDLDWFIEDLKAKQRNGSTTDILDFLEQGATWMIGPMIEVGDSCHPKTKIENQYNKGNLDIDWFKVLNQQDYSEYTRGATGCM